MIFLWFLAKLAKEVFGVSIISLLLLLILEDIKMGFVLNYVDLGELFVFCAGAGVVYLLLSKFEDDDLKTN